MRIIKRLLITLVLLVVSGIALFYFYRSRVVKSIVPKIHEAYIQNLVIENGIGRAHLILSLENKGVVSYDVRSMDLTLHNGSMQLMKYQSDSLYTLPAGERKDFDLEFEIDTRQLIKRIRNLQDKDSAMVSVKGNIILNALGRQHMLEVDKTIKVRVPDAPDIKIIEIEYLGVRNNDSIDFNLYVSVQNYNPNILGIRDASYRFSGKDFIESSGKLPDVRLDTSDTVISIIPVTLVTKRKMELLSKIILKQDPIEYELMLDGVLLLQNEKNKELNVSIIKKDKLSFDKKDRKKSDVKVTFSNKRRKERQEKRKAKREL